MNVLHEYWQSVHDRVCPVCTEGDGMGNCLLDPTIRCPLQSSLPVIIDVLTHAKPWRPGYAGELYSIICGECEHQTATGNCSLSVADCAVERHFSLIVEAVEHVSSLSAQQPPNCSYQ